jgi:hypothetical protein
MGKLLIIIRKVANREYRTPREGTLSMSDFAGGGGC